MMHNQRSVPAGRAVTRRFVTRSISAVFVALPLLAAACSGGEAGAPAAGGGRGAAPAMPVEAITLAARPVDDASEFVGTLRSRRSTTIQPQAEGFLTRILVRSGDRVTPGQPLFEIDAATQQAAVASLESLRAARQADASFAQQQAARAKTLLDVGATSQQEFEQAAAAQKAADAQLKAVDEQIRQAQAELAYHRVTSPTAGIVGDVPVRQGDRVTRSTLLTTVEDNSGLEVYINVPVQQAAGLRVGLPVRLLDESGAVLVSQKISFVAPSVDDGTQTVLVKAPIPQQGLRFRTEQFVRAQIVFDTPSAVTVPLVSALRVNGQYFVFIVEKGPGGPVARQRAVTLGRVVGNEYVVESGLQPGDQLIVGGIQKIGDGSPVAPTAPAPAPAPPGAPEPNAAGRGR
jgi:RND family efflux transporter MFP subunit